jgi:hypothetical protein
MKKLSIVALIYIAGTFINSGCSKLSEPDEFTIPKEHLEYYLFKPNSFFVYQNTTNNKYDTVRVYSNSWYWPEGRKEERHEMVSVQYKTSNSTFEYSLDTRERKECFDNNKDIFPCYLFSCTKYNGNTIVGKSIIHKFPLREGDWGVTGIQNSRYEVKEVYDVLNIYGFAYTHVAKVFINNCVLYDGDDVNLYWTKGYGLVKWENLSTNECWELVQASIVR